MVAVQVLAPVDRPFLVPPPPAFLPPLPLSASWHDPHRRTRLGEEAGRRIDVLVDTYSAGRHRSLCTVCGVSVRSWQLHLSEEAHVRHMRAQFHLRSPNAPPTQGPMVFGHQRGAQFARDFSWVQVWRSPEDRWSEPVTIGFDHMTLGVFLWMGTELKEGPLAVTFDPVLFECLFGD